MSSQFIYQEVITKFSRQPAWREVKLSKAPTVERWRDEDWLLVAPEILTELADFAYREINHYLRSDHLQQWQDILSDPKASPNDRYVAFELLKNANVSAAGELPMCQDTGTAIVIGHKGWRVNSGGDDERHISAGVYRAYLERNLRYSQLAPISMFSEKNTRTNLPAQIDIYQHGQADQYHLLYIAKGGGSANKSFLFQASPALLEPDRLIPFIEEKMRSLGTAACPPYHLAVVVGGSSAEMALKTVKLASCKALDQLPLAGNEYGRAFRDQEMEEILLRRSRKLGIGAQFGGKYFCLDVRVIRLPRHGASLPIALAVSCSADRQAEAIIDRDGVKFEQLEHDPARFLPPLDRQISVRPAIDIDLSLPMADILAKLRSVAVKSLVRLSGPLIVARDAAHLRIRQQLARGEKIPEYLQRHPVYYAGPAKTPQGMNSGSFGPTTASRMDEYVAEFQEHGASLVMLAKGNRSRQVRAACKQYGGFYLGSIGGPAAILAQDAITNVECIDFADLGMEAVWKIEVVNFPAFMVINDQGEDFFQSVRITQAE